MSFYNLWALRQKIGAAAGEAVLEPENLNELMDADSDGFGHQSYGMRIAQVAPLAESVPPRFYGGSERVVSWLTEDLVELGHSVTLFASGDSLTSGRLVPVWPSSLRLGRPRVDRS